MKWTLQLLPWTLGILRLSKDDQIPLEIFREPFYCVTRTDAEVSIVTSHPVIENVSKEAVAWRAIRFKGVLDFQLTGILADISAVLKKADISIFAISTHDTDYLLVKAEEIEEALESLSSNYTIEVM
jgi:hypothetical protein